VSIEQGRRFGIKLGTFTMSHGVGYRAPDVSLRYGEPCFGSTPRHEEMRFGTGFTSRFGQIDVPRSVDRLGHPRHHFYGA
jgi:hypothetical protein